MEQNRKTLQRDRTALVVIDVQQRINAVMADQQHEPRLRVLLQAFQKLGLPVLVTEQYPKGLGPTIPSLAPLLTAPPIEKMTFSCARDPVFAEALRRLRPDHVVVTGIEAHVCVLQTVLDLLRDGLSVHVPHDAVNSRRPADRQWALERLLGAGATITSTESVLFELLERCGTDDFRVVTKLIKALPVEGAGS